MAQPGFLITAASRSRQDGKSQWSRRAVTLHDQRHRGETTEEGGAWAQGEGYGGWAEGQGKVVGEDDEGEVGEEAPGNVGNAEVGTALETGKHPSKAATLWDGADDVCRWAMVVVGRSGRNDFLEGASGYFMDIYKNSRQMSPEQMIYGLYS